MAFQGGKLRSGAASGADTAFEVGAQIAYDYMAKTFGLNPLEYKHVHDIFLPFPSFNGRLHNPDTGHLHIKSIKAEQLASQFHPGWHGLGRGAREMMSRNSMQAMGPGIDSPARFVFCHTNDGAFTKDMTSYKTGGTGQAIRIASHSNIAIYNSGYPAHREKMQNWILECEKTVFQRYGVSPTALVDAFLDDFVGIDRRIEGNLVKMADKGEVDALIHGSNCFTMNSGIAKEIRQTFPEAYESFAKGRKGDKKRLGTIDLVNTTRNGKPVQIVNAFVQHHYGRDESVCYVDAEAVRKSFKAAAEAIPKGSTVGIPRIGSGLGNGCWVSMSNIIKLEMKDHNLVLVDLPGYELDEQYESPALEINKEPETDQLSLI